MKFLAFSTAMLFGIGMFAQKAAQVTAYNYMKDKEYVKAYEYITKAENDEKTGSDPKTFKYKGDILIGMAFSPDVVMRTHVEEPLDKAIKAWRQCLILDKKNKYGDEINGLIGFQRKILLDSAGSSYNSENYEQSAAMFAFAAKLYEVYDNPDSSSVFNTALAAENAAIKAESAEKKAEMYEMATEYYTKAFNIDFEAESSVISLVRIYTNTEEDEKKLGAIEMGLEKYPNSQALIIEKLNYFLTREKYDEAAENLEKAIENDPENEILHFALGVAYDNMGKVDMAVGSYKKALELKPDYFDAAYNYGAMVYNQGVELTKQANELDYRTKGKEIDALNAKANVKFKEAVELLENAHQISPEDKSTMQSLSQLYVRLGMNEKYKEMKEKL